MFWPLKHAASSLAESHRRHLGERLPIHSMSPAPATAPSPPIFLFFLVDWDGFLCWCIMWDKKNENRYPGRFIWWSIMHHVKLLTNIPTAWGTSYGIATNCSLFLMESLLMKHLWIKNSVEMSCPLNLWPQHDAIHQWNAAPLGTTSLCTNSVNLWQLWQRMVPKPRFRLISSKNS